MARLIAVSIDCRNEAARQTFEEIVSRRRNYLITKGQGTGAVDMLLLEMDELRPQQTFTHIRNLLSSSPNLEVFLTASRTDPQVLLEAFRLGVKEFLPQPVTRQEVEPALLRFEERFSGRESGSDTESGRVIAVIGAGPAGLAAATVAAERGHAVDLYDAAGEIGGQFNMAKQIPGKEEFHETIRYFGRKIEATGVVKEVPPFKPRQTSEAHQPIASNWEWRPQAKCPTLAERLEAAKAAAERPRGG